jgi:hypothetical protein
MTLLAEELVEEWLNRNGYFTIRGIKLGVHEIDLLALRVNGSAIEARHIEVQASIHPVSYLSSLPKGVQKATGLSGHSTKERSNEELKVGIQEWVQKKYQLEVKEKIRQKLYPGPWSFELFIHKVKFPQELVLLQEQGILIYRLDEIVADLSKGSNTMIPGASGSDLLELINMGRNEG